MPETIQLRLTNDQRDELERARDSHAKGYMRERATAMLQIADGKSAYHVANYGLGKRRKPDTIYRWLHRYEKFGVDGLLNRAGQGRKAAW